jgi:glycosyltransferase involved in cell wall biosynthesis
VRSDVPGLMSRCSLAARRSRLLFDIRGFWADERIDAGIWRRGVLYRIAKSQERRLFAAADGIVTLTEASVPQIREWLGDRPTPIHVIPTCTDVDRFADTAPRIEGSHAVWSGSISTWYRFDLALRLARALETPLTVLTRERAAAAALLEEAPPRDGVSHTIRSVSPAEIPTQLHFQDIGLCLVRSSFSKLASAPTRFAEFLAAGMPVAVTAGVGDLEAIVERHRVGVVLRDETDEGIVNAATELLAMARDRETCERCRQVARDYFDIREGVRRYANAYAQLTGA